MTTQIKVIAGITLATFLILIGGVLLLSQGQKAVPEGEIIARNGLHWHPRLSVYIKGQKQGLSEGIGLGAREMAMHTHKEDYQQGVIHMEIKGVVIKNQTKLGNFFQIWGKQLSSNCLLDKCNGSDGTVKMTVNGQENKDFENYEMKNDDNIELRFE